MLAFHFYCLAGFNLNLQTLNIIISLSHYLSLPWLFIFLSLLVSHYHEFSYFELVYTIKLLIQGCPFLYSLVPKDMLTNEASICKCIVDAKSRPPQRLKQAETTPFLFLKGPSSHFRGGENILKSNCTAHNAIWWVQKFSSIYLVFYIFYSVI